MLSAGHKKAKMVLGTKLQVKTKSQQCIKAWMQAKVQTMRACDEYQKIVVERRYCCKGLEKDSILEHGSMVYGHFLNVMQLNLFTLTSN